MSKTINQNMEIEETRVVRNWRMNKAKNTILFTIPRTAAKRYQRDIPTNMLVIPTSYGILIKKLETEVIR
jgi:hypothetical protein